MLLAQSYLTSRTRIVAKSKTYIEVEISMYMKSIDLYEGKE